MKRVTPLVYLALLPLSVACPSSSDSVRSTSGANGGSGGAAANTYDAVACWENTKEQSACAACCSSDLPGKTAHDYYLACQEHLTPSQEPGWWQPCLDDPCRFETVDAQHCQDRSACEWECDCDRCGGDECIDFTNGMYAGDGITEHCGECGHTCTGNVYCTDGMCRCPPDLLYCGGG